VTTPATNEPHDDDASAAREEPHDAQDARRTSPPAAADARPSRSRERLRIAALGIGTSALAFVIFGGLGALSSGGASSDPLDAMPKASFLVATVDADELRRSPVYEAVFGKDSAGNDRGEPMRAALGMGSLADACGFDPLARVQKVAVSVPEEGERGEFGIAAKVEVTRDELERCTRALASKRGDDAKVAAREVGSFVVVDAPGGSSARPSLGYGRGGLLVVGKGAWFEAMLGAAQKQKPGARDAQEHAALRSALTSREGFRTPTLLVTAILPRSLRERLRREMGGEASHDASAAAMAGVLGVSSLGIALRAGSASQSTDAAVELVCDTPDGCEAVEKLVRRKRLEWSKDLTLRMIGLGPLVDSLDVSRDGTRLRASASAGSAALASTIDRILRLRGGSGGAAPNGAPRDPSPPGAPHPRGADETVPAKPH